MKLFRRLASAALLALASSHAANAQSVAVAVAANFTAPMQKIAALFEAETGYKAALAFGSTGRFYAQIKNGAPFDVLIAADERTPAKLVEDGLAQGSTRITYAVGKLVLHSRNPSVVDDKGDVLKQSSLGKISIADPKISPYGLAAQQALHALGVYTQLAPRLVVGESIGQAYQFVATENAVMGFVAMSQVSPPGQTRPGSSWVVPQTLYDPIRQDAVVLARGKDNPAALALLKFLQSQAAHDVIRSYGYSLGANP